MSVRSAPMECQDSSRIEGRDVAATLLSGPPRGRAWIAALAFLAALWALAFVPQLGHREVTGAIEARVGITSREMWRAGEWVLPTMNGQLRLQKPPLAYWAVEALALLRGTHDDATLRWPFALFALGVLAFTWAMGRQLGGESRGLAAGLILLTSALFVKEAQIASADIPLAFGVAAAWCFYLADRIRDRPACRLALWASLGVASLAKGPVGCVPVVLPALVEAAMSRSWRPLRSLRSGVGIVLFLVLGLAWPAAVILRLSDQLTPAEAIHRWFLESFGKVLPSDGIEDGYRFQRHGGPFHFYLLRLPAVLGFWTVLLIPWAVSFLRVRGWRQLGSRLRGGDLSLLPPLWVFTTVAFFSSIAEKKTSYMVPVLPAVSLWLAATLEDTVERWRQPLVRAAPWLAALAGLVLAAGMGMGAFGLPAALAAQLPEGWSAAVDRLTSELAGWVLGLGALGLGVCLLLRPALRAPGSTRTALLLGTALCVGGFLYGPLQDELAPPTRFRETGCQAREALAGAPEALALGNLPAGLLYYADRVVRVVHWKEPGALDAVGKLPSASRVLARERTLDKLVPCAALREGAALPAPLARLRVERLVDAGSGSERDRVVILAAE